MRVSLLWWMAMGAGACGSPKAPITAAETVAEGTLSPDAVATTAATDAAATAAPADAAPEPEVTAPEPTPLPEGDPLDEAPEQAPPPKPRQKPGTVGDYSAPAALDAGESARRFPRGNPTQARQANKVGREKRAAGDDAGALAAYQAAVAAAPGYAPARYNLACELARSDASRAAALEQLEELLRLGTAEARQFVARAGFDDDFAKLRGDGRFSAITGSVRFEPSEPFAVQLCDDPGRIATLIDPVRGFVDHSETEGGPDGSEPSLHTELVKGKAAYTAALQQVLGLGYVCGFMQEESGSLLRYRLADAGTKDPVCLRYDAQAEWAEQWMFCLSHEPEGWRLASMGVWPTGPLTEEYGMELLGRVRAARDQGLAIYGKSIARPK